MPVLTPPTSGDTYFNDLPWQTQRALFRPCGKCGAIQWERCTNLRDSDMYLETVHRGRW